VIGGIVVLRLPRFAGYHGVALAGISNVYFPELRYALAPEFVTGRAHSRTHDFPTVRASLHRSIWSIIGTGTLYSLNSGGVDGFTALADGSFSSSNSLRLAAVIPCFMVMLPLGD
jgi:hypothetical protein